MPILRKQCVVCGQKKAMVLFALNKTSADGRDGRCKRCFAEIRAGQRVWKTQAQIAQRIRSRG